MCVLVMKFVSRLMLCILVKKLILKKPTIPIDQLRAQIANLRHININNDKKQSWIIVESGSGSGILL